MIDPFKSVAYHTSTPENPIEGDIYYNSIESTNYIYQKGKWLSLTFHMDVWTDKSRYRRKKIRRIYES